MNSGHYNGFRKKAALDEGFDFATVFEVLWRGKWRILLMAAVFVGLGLLYATVLAQPTYRSTAVLVLDTREERIVEFDSVIGGLSGDTSVVNTEVEVLKGRELLGKVVGHLDLSQDPEFNETLLPKGLAENAISFLKGVLGVGAADDQLSPNALQDQIIDALLSRTTVRNLEGSLVFEVTVETGEAAKSAKIADTIAELYILEQLAVKFEATQRATMWLTERVGQLQTELEANEARVKAFSAETNLVDAEGLAVLESQLKDLRTRLSNAREVETASQDRVAELKAASGAVEKMGTAQDRQLDRLGLRLSDGADQTVSDAFEARFQQILTTAEVSVDRARAQRAALEKTERSLEDQIADQSADLIELQQLTREAEASRLLYEYFLNRRKETSVQQGIHEADSRILSRAVVSQVPASPQTPFILAICGVLGLFFGTGQVMLREARSHGLRSADVLERAFGLPVLGQIPRVTKRRMPDLIKYLHDKPTSWVSEAVRQTRTSLMLATHAREPKVVVLTSALPGEGKTMMALALAQSLGQFGKKVLLVEGDLRRRVITDCLEESPPNGLLSVLAGDVSLADAVARHDLVGADILVAQPSNSNPADTFSSQVFDDFLKDAREVYDVIIIDTPPVLLVPDARVLSKHADTVLFLVRWDQTTDHQVRDGLRMLENIGAKVAGFVLTRIDTRRNRGYGNQDQYGMYGSYGQKYFQN